MDDNLFSLSGRTAAVIGGGGVLAGEMAMGLGRAGADVAVLDFNAQAAEARAAAVRELGRRALGLHVDATSKAGLQAALDRMLAEWGQADILINAAGINSSTPFFEITEEEWQRLIDVDLKSVFLACQVFGKAMVESGRGGSIINISSVSSGPPLSKVFTYAVAKGGVNQITQFLAREWAGDFGHDVAIGDLIVEAFHEAHTFHPGKKIAQLSFNKKTAPWKVKADPKALRHAFSEIMLNALQANPTDARIQVRMEPEAERSGGAHVQIEIQDNGAGFSPEAAEKGAEPFFTTRPVGLGLGLTVSRKILETHQGHLSILKAPGGQAGVVRVSLPLEAPVTGQD